MKKDRYVFPSVLTYNEDDISIEFPDLPGCLPCALTTEEALANAKDAMALHLWGMERDGDEIPEATPVDKIKLESNQIPVLVEVFMPAYRDAIESQSVKKTLTIPRWLNDLAEQRKVNFSQILQSALKGYLGVSEMPQGRKAGRP